MTLTADPLSPRATAARPQAPLAPAARAGVGTVKSEALFGDAVEVLIDHCGVLYRLRRTSLGKLILTK